MEASPTTSVNGWKHICKAILALLDYSENLNEFRSVRKRDTNLSVLHTYIAESKNTLHFEFLQRKIYFFLTKTFPLKIYSFACIF